MKICIDTSILVELDRKNEKLIHFLKTIIKDHDIFLSVISILEILTGSNLRKDRMKAVNKAKSIMGQFIWVDIDSEIAEKSAEINAFLITQGEKIEIQDVIIAASSMIKKCDYILTYNKDHFTRIPSIKKKVLTPEELNQRLQLE